MGRGLILLLGAGLVVAVLFGSGMVGGGSAISRPVRWFLVLGGIVIYFAIATIALLAEALWAGTKGTGHD